MHPLQQRHFNMRDFDVPGHATITSLRRDKELTHIYASVLSYCIYTKSVRMISVTL